MNLCFSTLGCTERSLDEILELCREYGISLLEIRGIDGELDNRKIKEFGPEKLNETLSKFEQAGVKPIVLGTSCAFDSERGYDEAILEGRAALLTAQALGARAIRVFGNNLGKNPEESTNRVISGLKTLCESAQETGVDVLLEVHGDFNTVEALAPVLNEMKDEKRFGILWDICHTQGTYGENWREFYSAVRPFIRHLHIKDIKGKKLVLPGKGEIPIRDIVSQLLADGYSGAFSLEWEKKWHPLLPKIEKALTEFAEVMTV